MGPSLAGKNFWGLLTQRGPWKQTPQDNANLVRHSEPASSAGVGNGNVQTFSTGGNCKPSPPPPVATQYNISSIVSGGGRTINPVTARRYSEKTLNRIQEKISERPLMPLYGQLTTTRMLQDITSNGREPTEKELGNIESLIDGGIQPMSVKIPTKGFYPSPLKPSSSLADYDMTSPVSVKSERNSTMSVDSPGTPTFRISSMPDITEVTNAWKPESYDVILANQAKKESEIERYQNSIGGNNQFVRSIQQAPMEVVPVDGRGTMIPIARSGGKSNRKLLGTKDNLRKIRKDEGTIVAKSIGGKKIIVPKSKTFKFTADSKVQEPALKRITDNYDKSVKLILGAPKEKQKMIEGVKPTKAVVKGSKGKGLAPINTNVQKVKGPQVRKSRIDKPMMIPVTREKRIKRGVNTESKAYNTGRGKKQRIN